MTNVHNNYFGIYNGAHLLPPNLLTFSLLIFQNNTTLFFCLILIAKIEHLFASFLSDTLVVKRFLTVEWFREKQNWSTQMICLSVFILFSHNWKIKLIKKQRKTSRNLREPNIVYLLILKISVNPFIQFKYKNIWCKAVVYLANL